MHAGGRGGFSGRAACTHLLRWVAAGACVLCRPATPLQLRWCWRRLGLEAHGAAKATHSMMHKEGRHATSRALLEGAALVVRAKVCCTRSAPKLLSPRSCPKLAKRTTHTSSGGAEPDKALLARRWRACAQRRLASGIANTSDTHWRPGGRHSGCRLYANSGTTRRACPHERTLSSFRCACPSRSLHDAVVGMRCSAWRTQAAATL